MTALDLRIADALDRIALRGERRRLVATGAASGGRVMRGGATLIDASSNDYLGLAHHPLLIERAREWTSRLGTGAGASRLVTGTLEAHRAIEAKVAAFKGKAAALLFASGWQANAAVLAALLKAAPDTRLFADRLIHASLHAGAAGHRQQRFRHNDLDHLETLLAAAGDGPKLIVTESVFSMDGDIADLPRLVVLARTHDAFLYVDEAHATGVLGPQGRGLAAGLDIDLVMGTFSKALGGFGAYVAGSQAVIDWLVNAASGFVFSTAPPPAMLGAIDAALDLVPGMDAERATLARHGARLRSRLAAAGIDTAGSATQIVPAIVGEATATVALAARMEADGILAAAIRPPTVPPGTSRLRLALRSTLDEGDVEAIADRVIAAWPR